METVKVECSACGGTGLYSGFAESKGTAVVCVQCGGDGCEEITFTPFTHRKDKRGIHTIIGRSITYQEFQQGKMP